MLKRVDHIDMRVTDVEKQVAFFKQLGFVEKRRTPPPRYSVEVVLPGPDQVVFEIRQAKEGTATGIDHVAFLQETPETREKLEEIGITFSKKPNFVQDTGRTVSNFTDEDGNRWQLTD
jgi:catechol 2,3-dioxygenase-like lactoylglutathione lyase family enzyme